MEAELIVRLCDRFHCLPSQLLNEDASLLRLLTIYHRAHPDSQQHEGEEGESYGG